MWSECTVSIAQDYGGGVSALLFGLKHPGNIKMLPGSLAHRECLEASSACTSLSTAGTQNNGDRVGTLWGKTVISQRDGK